jgi:pyruvate dehydrogenase E2 component (dihydrolipoamide acetyltransferase)
VAREITMPKLSDTMEEGRVLKWLVSEGELVERGSVIAEIETDKADMEMEAFDSGVLLAIRVPEGGRAAVGDVIGWIGKAGEQAPEAGAPVAAASARSEESAGAAEAGAPAATRTRGDGAAAEEPREPRRVAGGREGTPQPERRTSRPAGPNGDNASVPGPHADIADAIETEAGEEEEGEEGYATQAPPGTPSRAGRPTKGLNDRLPPHSAREERTGRLKISPVARRLADEGGIDPASLEGSGPDGRIVKSDVERALARRRRGPHGRRAAAPGAPGVPAATRGGVAGGPAEGGAGVAPAVPVASGELGTEIPHSRLRRAVAARMAESKRTVPHFYTTVAVRMDDALRLKDALALRDPDARVSVSHLIVKASALALERWPRVNAVFEEDRIRIAPAIHVGLAVAVEDGLIVPVIRDVGGKGLLEIAAEARGLVERVRRGRLAQDDLQGATFSVSNMGMFEIESFAAIIAPPQTAILAVGGIADEPVVRDGRVTPGKVMRLTLSADHRAIDGSLAAAFLVEVRRFLENPLSLVV